MDAGVVVVELDEDLEWRTAKMPYSSGPVELVLLHKMDDGAISVLVRFPVGWSRLIAGYYPVAEEFVVLQGELNFDGLNCRPCDWVLVPAGLVRSATSTPKGALAWARFDGPAHFQATWGESPAPDGPCISWQPLLTVASAERILLTNHIDNSTSSVTLFCSGTAVHTSEVLAPMSRRWAFVCRHSVFPDLDGPVLVREYADGAT